MSSYMDEVNSDIEKGNEFVAWFIEILDKIVEFFNKVKDLLGIGK